MGYKFPPRFTPNNGGMKLNVGSGRDIREGFINLDRLPHPGIDMVWDIENNRANGQVFPFKDNLFNHILARDVLEHIPHRVRDLDGEFFFYLVNDLIRITEPRGTWEIISPHRPECLGAAGHTRLIDASTFAPWMHSDRGSLEGTILPQGRLRTLHHVNNRQWDPKDWTRFGRSIVKTLHFEVIKDSQIRGENT